MGMILNNENKCIQDLKPYLLLIQKTNIYGVNIDKKNIETPELSGIVPVAGLTNAYDADVDVLNGEVS